MWQFKGKGKGKGLHGKGNGKGKGKGFGFGYPDQGKGFGHGKGGGKTPPMFSNNNQFGSYAGAGHQYGHKPDSKLKYVDQMALDSILPPDSVDDSDVALLQKDLSKTALRSLFQRKIMRYLNLACSAVSNSRDQYGTYLLNLQDSLMGESGVYCLHAVTNTKKNMSWEELTMWSKLFSSSRDSDTHMLSHDGSFMTITDFMLQPDNVSWWETTGRKESLDRLGANKWSIISQGYWNDADNYFVSAGTNSVSLRDYFDRGKTNLVIPPSCSKDTRLLSKENFDALVKEITALVVKSFEENPDTPKDLANISGAVSKAVSTALMSPAKSNNNTEPEGQRKKKQRSLNMNSSASSSASSSESSPTYEHYFDMMVSKSQSNAQSNTQEEIKARATIVLKISEIITSYHSAKPDLIPAIPDTPQGGKRKIADIKDTPDFTLNLYTLLDEDTSVDCKRTKSICKDLNLTYPTGSTGKSGFTCLQNALMKISVLCWNWFSKDMIAEPTLHE